MTHVEHAPTSISTDSASEAASLPTVREAADASRLLLTVPQAARSLGISRSKLYELIARRAVQSIRIDGCRRLPVEALESYVATLLDREEITYAPAS